MQRPGWTWKKLSWMERINLQRLHSAWFHLGNISEITILKMENKLVVARVRHGEEEMGMAVKGNTKESRGDGTAAYLDCCGGG